MTIQIDKAGRIVVPKPIRERLGLSAGSGLTLEETPEGFTLRPLEERPSLIRKKGFLVYGGELPPGFDIVRAIEDEHQERARKIWGLD